MGLYYPKTGFAQTQYSDQCGTALPGQLVNASDINMCDAVTSWWPDNPGQQQVTCGSFVAVEYSGADIDFVREGVNTMSARQVTGVLSATQSLGVVVRTQQVATSDLGIATVYHKTECTVLRSDRVGGRVWVWVRSGEEPEVGARSGYVRMEGSFTYLTSSATGGQPITNIIVHGVEPAVYFVDSGVSYKIGLVEFTTR
jgi:hypothetical protein